VLLCGCTSPATPSSTAGGIGDWPTFLPTPTDGGVATGSSVAPAMSYAGSPVVVALDDASVTVNVDGPSYPADTKLGADSVTCTFTVTFRDATAAVDLTHAYFDVVDHAGGIHRLTAAPASALPATLKPGAATVAKLVTTLPSGEGFVRFFVAGATAVAGWDYVAETD